MPRPPSADCTLSFLPLLSPPSFLHSSSQQRNASTSCSHLTLHILARATSRWTTRWVPGCMNLVISVPASSSHIHHRHRSNRSNALISTFPSPSHPCRPLRLSRLASLLCPPSLARPAIPNLRPFTRVVRWHGRHHANPSSCSSMSGWRPGRVYLRRQQAGREQVSPACAQHLSLAADCVADSLQHGTTTSPISLCRTSFGQITEVHTFPVTGEKATEVCVRASLTGSLLKPAA